MSRRVTTAARLLDERGEPLADRDVVVEQVSHFFGFGCIGFDLVPYAAGEDDSLSGLAELWLDLFSTTTLPFYWGQFEPVRGEPDTARLLAAARWFVERGIPVKGHPLLWHTLAPGWLEPLVAEEVEAAIRGRIRRDVTDFRGLVTSWDAINEPVILPVFDNPDNAVTRLARDRGRLALVRLAFDEARATDPTAALHINDFDLSVDYERVIGEALDAGVTIDGIGLQTHMHQGYRGEEAVLAIVDRFARFGLPIHMTETTLVSGELMPAHIVDLNDYVVSDWPSTPEGEERQAREVERHYRSLVGHPAVASVTYWGLTDAGAWLGAPAGLVRADGTPKPAYDRLHSLVRGEWWQAATPSRTNGSGVVEISGFPGVYRVAAGAASATVTVDGSVVVATVATAG